MEKNSIIYRRSNLEFDVIEKLKTVKVTLDYTYRNKEYREHVWVGLDKNQPKHMVLMNLLSGLGMVHLWGLVLPRIDYTEAFDDCISKLEFTLVPEAYDVYLEQGIIDKKGHLIFHRDSIIFQLLD